MKRNKVRRRLKEIFRFMRSSLPDGADIVVSARPAAAEASFEELKDEFLRFLHRLDDKTAAGEAKNAP